MSNTVITPDLQSNREWSEIITPQKKLLDLRLKDVWRYKDLLFLFVKRDLAAQYKQTVLGPVWYVIQPIFTTVMFLLLFHRIANIGTGALPPILFYMCTLSIWTYFSTCLTNTSNTFVANAGIFGKVYFPRLVLPLSSVLSNIAKFGIQLGLLTVVIIYYAVTGKFYTNIGLHTLLIPVIVVIMAGMGLGLGIIISSLTTKYRDFAVLVTFGVQLLMYVTPVPYPLEYLEQNRHSLYLIIKWNPLSPLVQSFVYAVYGTGSFDALMFLYSIAVTFLLLFFGTVIFNKVERSFMDTV